MEEKIQPASFWKKTSNLRDIEIEFRLDALRRNKNNNSYYNNGSSNIPLPSPLPSNFLLPTAPPFPPPPAYFSRSNTPTFFNFLPLSPQPQAPASDSKLHRAPPLSPDFSPFISSKPPTDVNKPTVGRVTKFGKIEAVRSEQEAWKVDIKNEIDESMKSVPSPPRLELSNEILNLLNNAEDIINNDFVKVDEFDDKDIQEIKDEYSFDDIKNEFDGGKVPEILEFFYEGVDNEKPRINWKILGLTGQNTDLIDYLCSKDGEQLLQESSISIYLETGNIFHDNFNTRESFYLPSKLKINK